MSVPLQEPSIRQIKQLLEDLKLSKGFRNLPSDTQAVIRVSILSRNLRVAAHTSRLLELEKQGQAFDKEIIRLLVSEILNRDQSPHIIALKEAVSRKAEAELLEKLTSQFDAEDPET